MTATAQPPLTKATILAEMRALASSCVAKADDADDAHMPGPASVLSAAAKGIMTLLKAAGPAAAIEAMPAPEGDIQALPDVRDPVLRLAPPTD